jgi:hypothetical protein
MKKHFPIILILVCAAILAVGIMQLFKLRFEAGDVYPAYSSLRADPLGTMALYESLEALPGISVRRDHAASGKLPEGKDTTYLHLATQAYQWESLTEKDWKEVEGFLISGGRLVITTHPETGWNFWQVGMPAPTPPVGPTTNTNTPAGTNAPGTAPAPVVKRVDIRKQLRGASEDEVTLEEQWGVSFDSEELPKDEEVYHPVKVVNKSDLALPRSLEWHSATVFSTNLSSAWRTIYARGTKPVVIERKFGAGSVVFATDSYFLSNEAMRADRHADFLSWLVGANRRVVFDEAHFGIIEEGGIALLIRKYRLHGLALALLVLAGLFVWKNSLSLVPPLAAEKLARHVVGKDSTAGFVNLLRRNIPTQDVLNVCFTEWTKSLLMGRHYTITGVDQAQAEMEAENARPPRERDPVSVYRRICHALRRSEFRVPSSELRASDTTKQTNQQHQGKQPS